MVQFESRGALWTKKNIRHLEKHFDSADMITRGPDLDRFGKKLCNWY